MEVHYIVQGRGYLVAEIPVNWSDQPGSNVRFFRDGVAFFRELAIIHRNAAKGYYSHPLAPSAPSPLPYSAPVLE